MKTDTPMTTHKSPARRKRDRKRRERERNAGTTGGPITTRIASPEELAELRATPTPTPRPYPGRVTRAQREKAIQDGLTRGAMGWT